MKHVVVPIGLALHGCAGAAKAPETHEATALPTWDEVPSPHPPGATNPPSPVLLVTPEGACSKQWVSPFLPPELRQDRVTPCPSEDPRVGDCGTPVRCPERAEELLAAWKAEQG